MNSIWSRFCLCWNRTLKRSVIAINLTCGIILFILGATSPAFASGLLGKKAMSGYDPVDYFQWGITVRGKSRYFHPYDYMVYYFDTEENMEIFRENPEQYAPQFGGHCAYHAATGRIIPANPEVWEIIGGKLYLFLNQQSMELFMAALPVRLPNAQRAWKAYKSPNTRGEELALKPAKLFHYGKNRARNEPVTLRIIR